MKIAEVETRLGRVRAWRKPKGDFSVPLEGRHVCWPEVSCGTRPRLASAFLVMNRSTKLGTDFTDAEAREYGAALAFQLVTSPVRRR